MAGFQWQNVAGIAAFLITQTAGAATFSPYTQPIPRTVYWGDTHLHSSLSADAFGFGVRLDPQEAFEFASGKTVTATHGLEARLDRPLDFVVLSDHAESFGLLKEVLDGAPALLKDPQVQEWHSALNANGAEGEAAAKKFKTLFQTREGRWSVFGKLETLADEGFKQSIWDKYIAAAEQHNQPGRFSTLLGFEWTSAPGGSNLHRVVIFKDGGEKVSRVLPLSSTVDDDPMSLWRYLESYESTTEGGALAIPHNGNLSNGLMFPLTERLHGRAVDKTYAEMRARWEPVVEVTQMKGDGETHGLLSPDDEYADYETWDFGNFAGVEKTEAMLPHEYARSGLGIGLQLEATLGINPYQFGMIGSTDSHTGLATAGEDNFFGKHSAVEPSPERVGHIVGKGGERIVRGWELAASGYAAVWATDNTREALFDALKRREVYATTGSRITVRFFGGYEFNASDLKTADIAALGYRKGVPMGGVLPDNADEQAPTFLLSAMRDPLGANLSKLQIIKVWLDGSGERKELVFDVASAAREGSARRTASGLTLDGGAPALMTVWQDPEFKPNQSALYYARVIEQPSPRWTAYEAERFGMSLDADIPTTTQDRAYTSPIWYQVTQ